MNKKILFLSYYWNFSSDPVGIQNRRFYQGLKEYSNVHIYYRDYSESVNNKLNEYSKFHPVKSINLSVVDKILYKLFPFLNQILSIDQSIWSIACYNKILKERTYYDVLYLTSNPFPINIIGRMLNKKNKKPIIIHLYDPLYDNYYIKVNPFTAYLRKIVEARIVKNYSTILLSNKIMLDRFSNRYKRFISKFSILPLCTDIYDVIHQPLNDKITIIHAGNLYGKRNINFINSTISYLREKHPNLSEVFQIILFGSVSNNDKKTILESHNEDIILNLGVIEKSRLYLEFAKADGLLVIDCLDFDNIFFPSKLCEYYLFNKIIFSITPDTSATRNLILESGHFAFNKNEIPQFTNAIDKLITDRFCYNSQFKKDYYKNFLPKVVAARFLTIISKSNI